MPCHGLKFLPKRFSALRNCAGRRLHDFLPQTKAPLDALRAVGRAMDLEWEDNAQLAERQLDGGAQEAAAWEALQEALRWARSEEQRGKMASWQLSTSMYMIVYTYIYIIYI